MEYPLQSFGGTEVLVRELLRGLSDFFEIVLVTDDETSVVKNTPHARYFVEHLRWNLAEASQAASRKLADDLHKLRVRIAHFHSGGNYGWNMRRLGGSPHLYLAPHGIPCFTTSHGVFALLDGYCNPGRATWQKALLLIPAWLGKMQTLLHTRQEFAVSKNDLRNLQSWYRPLAEKFGQIYHSQIDENTPPAEELPREKIILCVGTIGHRKGQAILARAFAGIAANYPGWKLILAGKKTELELVRQIEATASVPGMAHRIEMREGLNDAEINRLFRTASVFAMPSVAEGLGLSLQEALWHGCPAVGSRVGGIPELIDHQSNGLLVPPGDETALAAGLATLLSDEALRQKFAQAARPSILARGMTSQRMIARYRSLYDPLLS